MKTKVVAVTIGIATTTIIACVVAFLLTKVMEVPSFLYILALILASIELYISVGLTRAIIMTDLG